MTLRQHLFVLLIFSVFAPALLLLSACTKAGKEGTQADHKTVRVAANIPLSGDLSVFGQCVREASTLAIEDLKSAGLNGPNIRIDWQDNAGQPSATVSIMQKQFIEPPDVYVSGVHPQTMAIKGRVEAKGTPHFVWIFDQHLNKNSNDQASKNNFRTWVNLKIEPPLFLAYARARKCKRVAIVYVRLSHTEEEYEHDVALGLKQMGITNILIEPYELGSKEYRTIALKVRDFKPDLIILSGFQKDLVGLVRTFRPFGLVTNGNTICAYDMLDAAKILSRDEVEGIRTTAPAFVTRADRPEIKKWTEHFRKRWNHEPLYTAAYAYDAIMIIYNAAQHLTLPAPSRQWIEALQGTKLNGVTGPLSFDDDGSLVTPVEVGVYHNGKLHPDTERNSSQ